MTACLILLATSTYPGLTWFQRYLVAAIFKCRLLKMAATIMTVEFSTIHHYSSLQENVETYLCSFLNRYYKITENAIKITENYVNYGI